MKNSTLRNSPQNFGTFFLLGDPRGAASEKAGFYGKIFSDFGRFGPHTEFFNRIGGRTKPLRGIGAFG